MSHRVVAPNFARGVPYYGRDEDVAVPAKGAWDMPYSPVKVSSLAPAGGGGGGGGGGYGAPRVRPVSADYVLPTEVLEKDAGLLSPRRSPTRKRAGTDVSRTYTPPPFHKAEPAQPFVSYYARSEATPVRHSLPVVNAVAPPSSLPAATSAPTTPRLGLDYAAQREHREHIERDYTRDYSMDYTRPDDRDKARDERPVIVESRPPERRHSGYEPQSDKDFRLQEMERELFAEKRKRGELEGKILELQSSSTVRVLEGKVAGLQSMLEEKALQHEKTMTHGASTEMRVAELINNCNHANDLVADLENQLGHHVVKTTELDKKYEKCMQHKEDLEHALGNMQRKAQQESRDHEDLIAEKERTEHSLRSDLRLKTRQVEEAEMEKLSCTDEIVSMQRELERSKMRLNDINSERQDLESRALQAEEHAERLSGERAQLQVVSDGLRSELEREADKTRSVISDLQASEAQRMEMEERMRHAEQEVGRLAAVEEKSNYLESSLQRAEDDIRNEIKMHGETRQRFKEAEERLNDVARLQQQLLQAEAEVAAKTEAIERMHETIEGHASEVSRLREEIEKGHKTIDTIHHDLESAGEYKRNTEAKIVALEREAQRASELDGKLRTYDDLLNERGNELRQAHAETARAGMAAKELKHRISEIAELDRRLDMVMRERRELEDELAKQQGVQTQVENDNHALLRQLEANQFALETERSQVVELDELLREAKQQLALRTAVEQQYKQLEGELNIRNNELGKERVVAENEILRAKHLEAELDAAHERQHALDSNFGKQVAAVEMLQLENGKQSVLLQEKEKDITRLTRDVEAKDAELQTLKESDSKKQQQLDVQEARISSLEERETRRTELVEQQMKDNNKLKEESKETNAKLSEETQKGTKLEAQVVQMEAEAVRCSTLEGKVAALQQLNNEKAQEIDTLNAQMATLKGRTAKMESDVQQAAQQEARIKDLKQQLVRQLEDIERLEAEESKKSTVLSEARKEFEREAEKLRSKDRQLEEERAKSAAITERVQRLEAAAAARSSLEGKIAGLEILAESKEAELRSVIEDSNHLRRRIKELESELGNRARVEDVMQEAQTQLMMKNDTISRLEKEEEKRRGLVEDQHREIIILGEKGKKQEFEIQNLTSKKIEAEARVQELLREGDMKVRTDEGELRERMMVNERLNAECRELRERTVNAERQARMREQRAEDLDEEVRRLRTMLQHTDEERGGLGAEINELKRQIQQERAAAVQSTSRTAELESDMKIQKEKEERLARSMGEDIREVKTKYEQKTRALEQRLVEEKAKADAGEREAARLREELTFMNTTRGKSLHGNDDAVSLPNRADTGTMLIREKADNLASEWERTKEVCT